MRRVSLLETSTVPELRRRERPALDASTDDVAIMASVGHGDVRAFELLYDRYAPRVYALLSRMLGPEDADDALIDAFYQAWRSAHAWDPQRGSALSWLLVIARSRALDRVRSQERRAKTFDALAADLLDRHPAPGDLVDRLSVAEAAQAVRSALVDLPGDQRLALELAYYEGLSQQAIADRTGAPLGTIKTRIRLGLDKVEAALRKLGWP